MTFSISLNLSGHFAYRYPSDSFTQTLEIRLHWITASSFLESSIGFMSLAFESCNFVVSFHCNFSYGYLLWITACFSWELDRARDNLFWRLWFRGYFSLWLVLLVLAWHCNFDKRSGAFIILTAISWSKIEATMGISEGPLPRWMVDVRISSFQAALIKYGNNPGERRACGPVSPATHIQLLLFVAAYTPFEPLFFDVEY